MKTVVITGSGRGFGLSMLEEFKKNDFNCVICDINEEILSDAKSKLEKINGKGKVISLKCDITNEEDITKLISEVDKEFNSIDIWINNAGVNQPDSNIWELNSKTINTLILINLTGTILATSLISNYMIKQGHGAIYVVEGHGSDDSYLPKLTLYGTSKRGITYFAKSLAKELDNTGVIIGRITPGIMITNFIYHSLGDGKTINISNKTKKIYNILGDYPETIAEYIVPKIINNTKNDKKIVWLTKSRAMFRFLKAPFNKRNFFGDNNGK